MIKEKKEPKKKPIKVKEPTVKRSKDRIELRTKRKLYLFTKDVDCDNLWKQEIFLDKKSTHVSYVIVKDLDKFIDLLKRDEKIIEE